MITTHDRSTITTEVWLLFFLVLALLILLVTWAAPSIDTLQLDRMQPCTPTVYEPEEEV